MLLGLTLYIQRGRKINKDNEKRGIFDWQLDLELYLSNIEIPRERKINALLHKAEELQDGENYGLEDMLEKHGCVIDINTLTTDDLIERHNLLVVMYQNQKQALIYLLNQDIKRDNTRVKIWHRKVKAFIKLWFIVEDKHKIKNILADSFRETAEELEGENTQSNKRAV